jgi:hypothetical protein
MDRQQVLDFNCLALSSPKCAFAACLRIPPGIITGFSSRDRPFRGQGAELVCLWGGSVRDVLLLCALEANQERRREDKKRERRMSDEE